VLSFNILFQHLSHTLHKRPGFRVPVFLSTFTY
jgi:hypothetical protein